MREADTASVVNHLGLHGVDVSGEDSDFAVLRMGNRFVQCIGGRGVSIDGETPALPETGRLHSRRSPRASLRIPKV